ncbi:aldolase/citrate lyase family protein [Flavobacteriaceae bacterium]|nr:aldolase/citrate lyase family protein [Flavobacteriaceae bacterium]|tara:strand:+ start:84 stop:791 length:708 start_codon:yes stop_codon:yes gene_type:complete
MGSIKHGIWRIHPSTLITELISKENFDFQIFDCEHGGYDFSSLTEDIRISRILKTKSFVRVGGLNQIETQKCLDLGADGIVFPQLSKIEDFEKAVKMTLHFPEGLRGFNPFVPDYDFGEKVEPEAKECIPIIETLSAVKDFEKIIRIGGINTFYIGVYDLSAQLDCIGELSNPKLTSIVDEIIDKTLSYGKSISLMINSPDDYQYYLKKGINSFVHGVDSFHLKNAFKKIINKHE